MALKITTPIKTTTDFETSKTLVFVDIYLIKGNTWANLTYFESQKAFKAGASPFTPALPGYVTNMPLNIPTNVFWGNNLATAIHAEIKTELEKTSGPNTITIVQDPYS